jgi:RNA polymerase sigma-70 factor (ECF subfamily)
MNDVEVIRRIRAGDVESFRFLVERYQRPLFSLIRNLTAATVDHESIAQDVFLAAYRNLASFDPSRAAFSTWLFTIGRNCCRNEVSRRRPVVREAIPEGIDPRSPDRDAAEAELFRQLDAALESLPFEQRTAFVLAELQGLTYEEISKIERVGLGTVKSRISRAREKLRALLPNPAEQP